MRFFAVHQEVRPVTACFVAAMFLAALVSALPGAAVAVPGPAGFVKLAEKVSPSVVNISVEKKISSRRPGMSRRPGGKNDQFHDFFEKFFDDNFKREHKTEGQGTGFIIDKEGLVVTNNHVVAQADGIKVKLLDDREFEAEVVGLDSKTDLALLKLKDSPKNLPALPLGDSDKVKVGQWVLAVGNPYGLEHSVSEGIISAKSRTIGAGPYDDFLQTSANINPGNSGGPLIDMDGKVIGINTAIVGQGIGFAIPVNLAKWVLAQLQDSGKVTRGWLGVSIQNVAGELAEYYGVPEGGALVGAVFPDNPAAEAGIEPGDIIVAINGRPVKDTKDLTYMVAELAPNEKATITYIREGRKKETVVSIAQRDLEEEEAVKPREDSFGDMGWRLSKITDELVSRHGIRDTQGVIVMEVDPEGKAAQAGIMPGDIIREVNRKRVSSPKKVEKAIKDAPEDRPVTLLVKRGRGFNVVEIQP